MKEKLKFIYVFFIIGFESLGNMSAVTVVLEEHLIKKNKWVTQEDLIDAITIARLGPGATIVNVVVYLGNKIAGFWGGVLATVSYITAPLCTILAVSGIINKAIEYTVVTSALKGCLVCICVMFIKSSIQIGKSVLVNWLNILFFIIGLAVAILFNVSCIWIVLAAILIGCVKVRFSKKSPSFEGE